MSPKNLLCAKTIGTVEECRSNEVVAVVGKPFQEEENDGSWPKGCYLGYSGGAPVGIWWNNHPTGSPNNDARQICTKGTDGRIVNV